MKDTTCPYEDQLLRALGEGRAPQAFAEPLREHVNGCASCAEVAALYELFQSDSERLQAAARPPEAGRVWWRANLAARREAARRALLPVAIAEKAALAVGLGVLIALLVAAAPWLAAQLERPGVFSESVLYGFSMPVLLATSAIACVLLAAGGLYALWAER
ncbi:MAG TPA: hypothetical protein VMW54_00060 [Terriglobia bacterium]|nr:hypothetical protein [Terriglobia bacterium]